MIDFVKITTRGLKPEQWLQNPLLSFTDNSKHSTGEVSSSYCHYEKLFLQIKYKNEKQKNHIFNIKGSLHKYFDGNNYTDFSSKLVWASINQLEKELKINPSQSSINGLEFGVNVKTSISPKEIFPLFLQYCSTPFQPMPKQKGISLGIECQLSQFRIKIYDKGLQYNLPSNLMRFEIHVGKMQYLHKKEVHIYTLQDLSKQDVYTQLQEILLSVFDRILKVQIVDVKRMKPKDRNFYFAGNSPQYWAKLRGYNKNTYKSKIEQFRVLQEAYKTTDIHKEIRTAILEKCKILHPHSSPVFTTIQTATNPITIQLDYTRFYHKFNRVTGSYQNVYIGNGEYCTECFICGEPFIHNSPNAKTCSKKCRNKKSNAYNNALRAIKRDEKTALLFNTRNLLNLERLGQKWLG